MILFISKCYRKHTDHTQIEAFFKEPVSIRSLRGRGYTCTCSRLLKKYMYMYKATVHMYMYKDTVYMYMYKATVYMYMYKATVYMYMYKATMYMYMYKDTVYMYMYTVYMYMYIKCRSLR